MERPSTQERAKLDELLFAPVPVEEPFPGYTFPVGSGGAQVYGAPEGASGLAGASGIELPMPSVAVVGDLVAVWGDTVPLGPNVVQLTGLPPVLIDLILLQPPQIGSLVREGFALGAGDLFTQEDIDCGRIGYRHEGEQAGVDSFTFTTPAGEIPTTEIQILIQEPPEVPPEHSPEIPYEAPIEQASEQRHDAPVAETPVEITERATPTETESVPQAPAPEEPVAETAEEITPGITSGPIVEAVTEAVPVAEDAASVTLTQESVPTAEPVVLPFGPVALPSLPPPWRVPFRVEAVCGTGLALVRLEGAGVWQYSRDDGETWHDIGRVYHGRARLLRPTERLRFVPFRGSTGRVGLGARAWRDDGSTAEYACLANTQALRTNPAFGPQLLQLRWTLDR